MGGSDKERRRIELERFAYFAKEPDAVIVDPEHIQQPNLTGTEMTMTDVDLTMGDTGRYLIEYMDGKREWLEVEVRVNHAAQILYLVSIDTGAIINYGNIRKMQRQGEVRSTETVVRCKHVECTNPTLAPHHHHYHDDGALGLKAEACTCSNPTSIAGIR